MIVLNFKSYKEALGRKAIKICEKIERVYKKSEIEIVVAPQFLDIPTIVEKFSFPVIAQHVDEVEEGKFTGSVSLLSLKEHKVIGSLLNHSEKKVELNKIERIVKMAEKFGIKIFALASDLDESKKILKMGPYSLSYEPPELIGSGRAVSKEKPEVLRKFIELAEKSKIVKMAGAGISTAEDVRKALEIGCDGVLISSSFVFSKNKELFLKKIVEVFLEFDRSFPKL
ncbi:MAG: triose-phosphate isomerase [Candidatus Aenigmarchaeota archaeon]|nr:triose-phosphate isomerase [Candidatus Aenigmarchaeota archaeon]MCX8190691.1 triose-phosphate isomerase [Candidatus Aenigmarchaeota archaeon]MDW8159940.1 triose-phosphate isomerase [Candidatus Aenigmarchaeota archaeon]